ncbi:MAG: GAF domain-containing sensor histidine kinase [Nitrolancea sp.]
MDLIERLLGITDVALAHIELHELLNELLGRIRDVLKTDEASILLTDPGEDALSLRVSLHPDQLVKGPIRVPIGVGFAGRIARTRTPIVVDNAVDFPFSNPAMLQRGVKSLMGVPMLLDDRVLGVIHVGMRSPRHFDESELRLLELAAARISLAVDRSNLFEAERRARAVAERAQRRDEFLARVSEILSSSIDQQVTLDHATQAAVPEIGDICTVVLIGRDGIVRLSSANSVPELCRLIPPPGVQLPRSLTDCPTIEMLTETGQTLLIEDNINDFFEEIATGEEHLRDLRCSSLKSAMRVPLKSGGRAIGVITFCLAMPGRRFTSDDVALAEDFAHLVALATDNTTLYLEAQHAIGARDEFISIASHELKTPLTTVKGYVQLLRRHMNEAVPDHLRVLRTLGQLQDQVGRFEELVDELLDVSRIQSDRIRLDYERFDLSYLVSQVVDRVAQAYEQESPHTVEFPIPGPVWGSWDQSRIDQVLTNVLSNAFKYSPAGSTVTVEVAADEAEVEIRVTDQGIGIPEEDIHSILQPFARGTGASQMAPGAGLGLYISNEIVARHGGSLTIESKPGQGSTFTIRLPGDLRERLTSE